MHKTQTYYTTQIEDYIKKLYYSISIVLPEDIDMIKISHKLDIWLHFASFGSRAICRNDLSSIIIDNRQSIQHQWEDFGHELCHILFHSGNQLQIPKMFLDYQEAKAKNFMLHFCIPTFMLRALDFPDTRVEAIYLITETFNVSFETAHKRLLHYENQLLASHLQKVFSRAYLATP
ncbi:MULTISPECIES: ImmA/IrrE family metallo-endopeptidase [Bacillus cereus group]|uniref:ImmA/IrrE family metallo-endopeptidase n=1 Tax=Bacillus cereus group TaxID=86661 RepID=UPI0005CE16EF|nr:MULTISPECIES: ImmA/IrrE family metallo-endopeptidase [Bacillus cereus group]PGU99385.1 ImmA/IrrE family metallo-endopeptidase [Bacillus thuringiensis]